MWTGEPIVQTGQMTFFYIIAPTTIDSLMSNRILLLVHLQTESGIQTTGCSRFEQTK
jgi:hypothetical protein